MKPMVTTGDPPLQKNLMGEEHPRSSAGAQKLSQYIQESLPTSLEAENRSLLVQTHHVGTQAYING